MFWVTLYHPVSAKQRKNICHKGRSRVGFVCQPSRRRYTFTKKWMFGYAACVSNALRTKFAVGETNNLLNYLNEMKQFKAALLTVEAICELFLLPDVRCYAKAAAILEDTKVIRGGGTTRIMRCRAHHALASPEHMSVSERVNGVVNHMKSQQLFIWSQAENPSNSAAAPC